MLAKEALAVVELTYSQIKHRAHPCFKCIDHTIAGYEGFKDLVSLLFEQLLDLSFYS